MNWRSMKWAWPASGPLLIANFFQFYALSLGTILFFQRLLDYKEEGCNMFIVLNGIKN